MMSHTANYQTQFGRCCHRRTAKIRANASRAVMAAQGSQLTNKYAEGYPGRRYYWGCEHVDRVEQLALDRVRRLFGADAHGWAANVQAHSGAQADAAVFLAFLKPGDAYAIPNDPEKPMVTSGIRLGSPAMTTRGFGEAESRQVGHLIADLLDAPGDAARLADVKARVWALTARFPVYR